MSQLFCNDINYEDGVDEPESHPTNNRTKRITLVED